MPTSPLFTPHDVRSLHPGQVPAAIAKAVVAVERERGTKRPPEQASFNPNPKARRGERGEPARVFHAGCPMFGADL